MPLYLLVSGDFRPHGGMDHPNHALASYLAGLPGAEVHLVAHRVEDQLAAHPAVHFHPVARPLDRPWLGKAALERAGQRWASRITARGGRVIVNGGNCRGNDINWVHYVHAAYAAPAQNRLRRIWQGWKHRRFLLDERRCLAPARHIVANSQRTRRDLVERLGLEPERIQVVYYGCDPAFTGRNAAEHSAARRELGWPEDRPQALFIGALGDNRKGFDRLYEVWRLLCLDPAWDVDLRAAGRGADLEYWRQRVRAEGMSGQIDLLGFRQDISRLLAAADVLIAPVRYEAYGLAVQEALCRGLPALVSENAGVAERYPPALRELLLPDTEIPECLVGALYGWRRQAATWPDRLAEFSESLRRHDWTAMAQAFIQATAA